MPPASPFPPRAAVEEVARATGALGLEDEADGFPPLPRLNIGGAEFQTRIAVLRSQPGSLLSECGAAGGAAQSHVGEVALA